MFALKLWNCHFKVASGICPQTGGRIFLWRKSHLVRAALQWVFRKVDLSPNLRTEMQQREELSRNVPCVEGKMGKGKFASN